MSGWIRRVISLIEKRSGRVLVRRRKRRTRGDRSRNGGKEEEFGRNERDCLLT
jgi:hypothetical protein